MTIRIEFDEGAFKRQFQQEANRAIDQVAKDYTRLSESLVRRYRGRPVADIKPVLKPEWRRITSEADITEPELTEMATLISNGTRITFRNQGLR